MTGLTNETIGNYRVVQQLGEGAMGVVCLAQHPIIGRKVAIKLLHPVLSSYPEVVTRFFNEARAIHTISHENVVEILDFGQTSGGQPYFIMEFLEGEPLSDTIARGAMSPESVAQIADQMCRALSAAHAKGIVHRDLKPQNVHLVTKPDGGLQVKLLDFGVAKILASSEGAQTAKTRTGSLMGTPLYMSPEQCRGSGAVDARADIYSLGVMLFEMLAGRPPFVPAGIGELFALHMFEPAPPVTDYAPNVPRRMAAAVMKSLAKDPGDRFQSIDELRDALAGELELDGPLPNPATTEPDDTIAPTKRRWKVPAIVGLLALAMTFAGFQLIPRARGAAAPEVAMPAPPPVVPATPPAPIVRPAPPASRASVENLPPPARTAAKKPAVARHRAKKADFFIDEDGLAKPTF